MAFSRASGICDLSTLSCVKVRQEHDGAVGFLKKEISSLKKLKVDVIIEGSITSRESLS